MNTVELELTNIERGFLIVQVILVYADFEFIACSNPICGL